MAVRRIGTWKDATRRLIDAVLACGLPGGYKLFPVLAQVDGYLYPHEAVFLYWLARSAPGEGAIVEIGSFRGRSTLCFAAAVRGRRDARIVAVDPHVYKTEAELRENLAHFGADEVVDMVVAPSVSTAKTWRGPVRVLFVDGNHEEAHVNDDLDAWMPHVEPGGFLLVHDSVGPSAFPGPAKVARKRVQRGPDFDVVGELGSITWGRRRGSHEPWDPPQWGRRTLNPLLLYLKGRRAPPG